MPGPAFGVPVIEYGLGYPKQGPAGTLVNQIQVPLVDLNFGTGFYFIDSASQLPAPVAGKITLSAGHYFLNPNAPIDIGANQIYITGFSNARLYGGNITSSNPTATIFCDGGYARFDSVDIGNTGGGDVIRIDNFGGIYGSPNIVGGTTGKALNAISAYFVVLKSILWSGSTGIDIGNILQLLQIESSIFTDNDTFKITGSVASFYLSDSVFSSTVPGITLLDIQNTASIGFSNNTGNRFITVAGQTGLHADVAAFAVQGNKVARCSFEGAGTALTGATASTTKALIAGCSGIANSAPRGYASFTGGATVTNATTQGIYYPIGGTFVAGDEQLINLSANEIVNNTGRTITVNVRASSGGSTSSPGDDWAIAIIKNGGASFNPAAPGGAVNVGSLQWKASGGAWSGIASGQTTLAPGDKLRPYIANVSAAAKTYTAVTANIIIEVTG